MRRLSTLVAVILTIVWASEASAQRRPVRIGGPNGIVMGGGMGFKVGGRNGIHFGGGQGAKFGPSEFGMHFGNGQGARFGSRNFGMQFGGGQGARFGSRNMGMQFGNGQGARFGSANYGMQFGGGAGARIGSLQNPVTGTPVPTNSLQTAAPMPNTVNSPRFRQMPLSPANGTRDISASPTPALVAPATFENDLKAGQNPVVEQTPASVDIAKQAVAAGPTTGNSDDSQMRSVLKPAKKPGKKADK